MAATAEVKLEAKNLGSGSNQGSIVEATEAERNTPKLSSSLSPSRTLKKRKINDFFGGVQKRPTKPQQPGQGPDSGHQAPVDGSKAILQPESSAKNAPLGIPNKKTLPLLNFADHGRMKYSNSAAEIEDICRDLLRKGCKEIGWDIEWRTTYKTGEPPRKTALMQVCYQLSSGSYCCLLFHVFFTGLPPSLRQLLESPDILKAGVNARLDAHKVDNDFGIQVQGIEELTEHPIARADEGLHSRSLASLAERYMHCTLSKNSTRTSNWEGRVLSYEQQSYAASDAFASLKLYQILKAMPQPPPQPAPGTEQGFRPYGVASIDRVWVPPLPTTKALPPAKATVYKLLTEKDLSIEDTAKQWKVQPSTIAAYLAEAILNGHGYRWPACNITEEEMSILETLANQLVKDKERFPLSLDILGDLQRNGVSIKNFHGRLNDTLDYGRIRVGLAHIGRRLSSSISSVCTTPGSGQDLKADKQ